MEGEDSHPQHIKIEAVKDNPMLSLALDTISIGKQALVFAATKASAEKCAETIAQQLQLDDSCSALSEKIVTFTSKPTKQCKRLSKTLSKGIAFHHSGLVGKQRELIETNFRNGTVKIICCTPTLAAGVDLPAFRTILKDLKRFSGGWGQKWIPVLEYEQMSGRAGRPGKEIYGEAIAISTKDGEHDEIHDRYICGDPEDIYSKLAAEPVLRTYLLSLIASRFVRTLNQIFSFFEKTFWAHQFGDMKRLEATIVKVLSLLEEYEFIKIEGSQNKKSIPGDDFISAADIEEVNANNRDAVITATLVGQRVSQLYLDPLTAHELIKGIQRAPSVQITTFSLLQLVCFTLEMRPLLSIRVKEFDLIQEQLVRNESILITHTPSMYEPEYEEYLRSIKTTLLLEEWIQEKDEEYLLEKYNARPGDLRAKVDNSDWLLYATAELAKLLSFHQYVTPIDKLRFRLKYGVGEELLTLLQLKNIGRVRARRLYANGIKNLGDIKSASLTTLTQLLGTAVARDVKEQVGDTVSEMDIKEAAKRDPSKKGQSSLSDF